MKPILPTAVFLCILLSQSISPCLADTIPPYPCDYYGREESSNSLKAGSVITAKDPEGVTIGRFTIVENGRYGLLSCIADDPDTSQDEGAVDGDIITFYINGAKQQRQAAYRSGDIIRVDLGISADKGMFNLHITDMPGYTSCNNDINYSSAAVADMIIDYLAPSNTDTQALLMPYLDKDGDTRVTGSELAGLLNEECPDVYNYASTCDVHNYSDNAIINPFDAANQNDCIKHICHWLAYDIPGAPSGKENIPIAVCTSSDTATNADSDYKHWMSVVGIRTNRDPCPALPENHSFSEYYDVPESLELYGVYVNDPNQDGLGFHSYIASDIWAGKYFRPIKAGLPEAGRYIAIFEPPEPSALDVMAKEPLYNRELESVLETAQKGVSIYIPGWIEAETKEYMLSVIEKFRQSEDFANLMDDEYFGKALKDTLITRCFKVDGKANDDYTIVPFDRTKEQATVTTAALILNNRTGQFQMAFADTHSDEFYEPMYFGDALNVLWQHADWSRERSMNMWLSNSAGNALFPGLSIITQKADITNPLALILTTNEYAITPDMQVIKENSSPDIEILDSDMYRLEDLKVLKYIVFKISHSKKCLVSITEANMESGSRFYKEDDTYFLTLSGEEPVYCWIKVREEDSSGESEDENITYMCVR